MTRFRVVDAGALVRLRSRLGLSQEALSLRMGTSQGSISQIERGRRVFLPRTAARLADALDTTIEALEAGGIVEMVEMSQPNGNVGSNRNEGGEG